MLRIRGLVTASGIVLALLFAGQGFAATLCAEAAGGGAPATPGLSAAQIAGLLNNTGGGCVARVAGLSTSIYVASDAEVFFDPFGFGADTSDGIIVPANYAFMGGNGWMKLANSLAVFPNSQTWVLPSDLTSIGCGTENEPTCEPTITFQNPLPFGADVVGTYIINETDGSTLSDQVILANVGGVGVVSFQSDPTLTPEPDSVLLLGAALVAVASFKRKYSLSSKRSA